MSLFETVSESTAHLNTAKTAAAGGTGGAVAIAAAMFDPAAVETWLRIATLLVGLITALGSGALVYLKLLQNWRFRHRPRDDHPIS